jgi:hypothetical protein
MEARQEDHESKASLHSITKPLSKKKWEAREDLIN